MKFRVTFKDPNAVEDALLDQLDSTHDEGGWLHNRMKDTVGKWVERQEYVTLEFDTMDGTCVVVPVKE